MRSVLKMMIIVSLVLVALPVGAQRVFDINLWNGNAPHKTGDDGDTAKVRVFLPSKAEATGRAVVICPGGGYEHLAMTHEGYDWAPFFNDMGIAAIVLKYRMPHQKHEAPVSDAEEAIRLVRANAANWNINPSDVGIMGFSAGGHLASTVATHAKSDARPDFQILFYPVITMLEGYTHQGSRENLIGKDAKKKLEQQYCNDLHVSRFTPRTCIMLSYDDDIVLPINSINFYTALYRHDVPASIYVYPSGGHGYGIQSSFKYHIEMLLDLKAWLRSF